MLGLVTLTGRTGWRWGLVLGLVTKDRMEMGPGACVGYSDWKDRMEMGPGAWVGY